MKKLRSPDDMEKYLQITNPGKWIILGACAALLIGLLIWAFFGTVYNMNDAKDRVAPTTYNNYRYIFDSHFEPYFSSLPKQDLDSITAKDINKYYNSLRKKGLSESTAAKHDQILTAAFNLAKRDGVITYNVMDGVKHPTEDNYEVNFYDIDQLNMLLQVAKDSPVYCEKKIKKTDFHQFSIKKTKKTDL